MAANSIIKVNNTTAFSWTATPSATKYHIRISRYYDFSIVDAQNTNVTTTVYTCVLTQGVAKYYYQFKPYVGSWQKWLEVNSFHRVSSGADLTITDAKWMMFEASERATYTLIFEKAPQYSFVESQLYRTLERNLAGDLLSEFWATKGKITLDFGEENTLSITEKNQVMRYFSMSVSSIYLACAPTNGAGYYRNIWRVYFTQEPVIQPLDGNEERFVMSLILEEC